MATTLFRRGRAAAGGQIHAMEALDTYDDRRYDHRSLCGFEIKARYHLYTEQPLITCKQCLRKVTLLRNYCNEILENKVQPGVFRF